MNTAKPYTPKQFETQSRKYARPTVMIAWHDHAAYGTGPVGISIDVFGGRYTAAQVESMLRLAKTELGMIGITRLIRLA